MIWKPLDGWNIYKFRCGQWEPSVAPALLFPVCLPGLVTNGYCGCCGSPSVAAVPLVVVDGGHRDRLYTLHLTFTAPVTGWSLMMHIDHEPCVIWFLASGCLVSLSARASRGVSDRANNLDSSAMESFRRRLQQMAIKPRLRRGKETVMILGRCSMSRCWCTHFGISLDGCLSSNSR